MTKAMEKELADLGEQVADLSKQVADLRGNLDALQAEVERMPGYENDDQPQLAKLETKGKGEVAPIEVGLIEIDVEKLKSVGAITEKDAQQLVKTKNVKINVAGKTRIEKATLENEKITVPAPPNLGEGLLVVLDLMNKEWGKIITLAYDVKTSAQGLDLVPRGAAEQKKFRQQEEYLLPLIASSPSTWPHQDRS